MSAASSARRRQAFRLLAEIARIGSPEHRRRAAAILGKLSEGRRVTETMALVVEANWREALNHAAAVRQIETPPPRGMVRSVYWRYRILFIDDWTIEDLRPGHPVSRLLSADGWSA
ncbi:MAG: hypothetical protein JO001_00425 [Alphaproteobacteria bacterium]|nr:hypothetical protein [Alphaproteobacteria bacterium]